MHMCIVSIVEVVVIVFAITEIGFAIGKLNKFGDSDDVWKEEQLMDTTQIWMLCVILAMVFFMILTAVWSKQGKSNGNQEQIETTEE